MSKFIETKKPLYTHILETSTHFEDTKVPIKDIKVLPPRLISLDDLEGIVELIADGADFILVEGDHLELNEKYNYYIDTRSEYKERARGEWISYNKHLGLIQRAGNTFEALPVGPGRGTIFIGEMVNDTFFLKHASEKTREAYFEHARPKMNEFKQARDMSFAHM